MIFLEESDCDGIRAASDRPKPEEILAARLVIDLSFSHFPTQAKSLFRSGI